MSDYLLMTLASGEIKMPLIKDYLGAAFEALEECGPLASALCERDYSCELRGYESPAKAKTWWKASWISYQLIC